jgi:hypothetical protein
VREYFAVVIVVLWFASESSVPRRMGSEELL